MNQLKIKDIPYMSCDFYANTIIAKYNMIVDSGIVKEQKHLTLEQFRDLFKEEVPFVSDFLPTWTLTYSKTDKVLKALTCIKNPDNMFTFDINIEPRIVSLNYPYMYFYIVCNKTTNNTYRHSSTRIFVSYESPSIETRLYVPYMSNINPNGVVCWGGARLEERSDFSVLKYIEDVFHSTVRNSDIINVQTMLEGNGIEYNTFGEWVASPIVQVAHTCGDLSNDSNRQSISMVKLIEQVKRI